MRNNYYYKNKDRIRKLQDSYKEDPEWCKRQQLRVIKCRARDRGIDFDITIGDLVWPDLCPLLEIPIVFGGDRWNTPSVDRRDSTKGYIKGNCFVISNLANTMKNSATNDQLMIFSKNIKSYLGLET